MNVSAGQTASKIEKKGGKIQRHKLKMSSDTLPV